MIDQSPCGEDVSSIRFAFPNATAAGRTRHIFLVGEQLYGDEIISIWSSSPHVQEGEYLCEGNSTLSELFMCEADHPPRDIRIPIQHKGDMCLDNERVGGRGLVGLPSGRVSHFPGASRLGREAWNLGMKDASHITPIHTTYTCYVVHITWY